MLVDNSGKIFDSELFGNFRDSAYRIFFSGFESKTAKMEADRRYNFQTVFHALDLLTASLERLETLG